MESSTSASESNESNEEEEEPMNDSVSIGTVVWLLVRDRGVKRKIGHNTKRLNLLTVGSPSLVVPVPVQSVMLK